MCVMMQTSVQLPKMTKNIPEKVYNLLLNGEQTIAIMRQEKWKVISGPFGSGKSLILKELAKRLYEKGEACTVYYICFDPYSLLEVEVEDYFEKLKKSRASNVELLSPSIDEISKRAGFNVGDIYNPFGNPEKNLADLLDYLTRDTHTLVHFLIDEFLTDFVTEDYCMRLGTCLRERLKNSTVVIAIQSMDKSREVYSSGKSKMIQTCNLDKCGMTLIPPFTKSMRMCKNLYKLMETAQTCVEASTTSVVLEAKESKRDGEPIKQSNKDFQRQPSRKNKASKKPRGSQNNPKANSERVENPSGSQSQNSNQMPILKKKKNPAEDQADIMVIESEHQDDGDNGGGEIVVDIAKLHEPEMIARKCDELLPKGESPEVLKRLDTKIKFRKGVSGITINSSSKPQAIELDQAFLLTEPASGIVLSIVLHILCLDKQHKTTIICNDMEQLISTKFALDFLSVPSTVYAPYLLNECPSKLEKREVINKMKDPKRVLVTDYRGFRGCETDHCVTFVSRHEKYARHVLVEVLSRAVAKTDVIVLPGQSDVVVAGSIGDVLRKWKSENLVEESLVQISKVGDALKVTVKDEGEESIDVEPYHIEQWQIVIDSLQCEKKLESFER